MSKIDGRGRHLEPWKDAIFGGRARRREYWTFALVNLVTVFFAVIALANLSPLDRDNPALIALLAISGLAALITFVATGVRRMHDSGHSGWWFACPLVNVYFTLIEGDPDVNRFGPNPKRRDPQATGSSSALAVVGSLAFVGILAAIALPLPSLQRRRPWNDMNAVRHLRALSVAQANFFQLCHGYSPDLNTLASANFITPDMTGDRSVFVMSGYVITLTKSSAPGTKVVPGQPALCNGPVTSYYASAIPLNVGSTGYHSYATNEQKKIYQDVTGAAIPDPPVTGGNVSQIQ